MIDFHTRTCSFSNCGSRRVCDGLLLQHGAGSGAGREDHCEHTARHPLRTHVTSQVRLKAGHSDCHTTYVFVFQFYNLIPSVTTRENVARWSPGSSIAKRPDVLMLSCPARN